MNGLPINQILTGDCRERLPELPDRSIQTVVTSVPYWGLRDYGIAPTIWLPEYLKDCPYPCEHEWGTEIVRTVRGGVGDKSTIDGDQARAGNRIEKSHNGLFCRQCGGWRGCYGLEPTPELYVEHTVQVFREVRRVLRDDGTLWLNIGDSYNAYNGNRGRSTSFQAATENALPDLPAGNSLTCETLKPKDLVGIPWRVAFALQADGWYLRQDIIWHKPNPMPESVTDRCTKAHEYIFLLTKSARYYYDAEAIKEPQSASTLAKAGQAPRRLGKKKTGTGKDGRILANDTYNTESWILPNGRNKRSVWTVPTAPYKQAHFATFPPELIRPCILAGTSEKGCCPQCGAPWRRVVEKSRVRTRPGQDSKAYDRQAGAVFEGEPQKPWNRAEVGNRDLGRHVTESQTIGWRPGCKCYEPAWTARCEVLEEELAARARRRNPRKRRQQDLADRWFFRACRYAMGRLMPREHTRFAAVPCVALDPFGGSGTTVLVAAQERRDWILIEAKPEYCDMARRRTDQVMKLPLFAGDASPSPLSVTSVPSVVESKIVNPQ